MRYSIPTTVEGLKFRLLTTPLFCGIEPITQDESIFPFEIDRSIFPKNCVRLFEMTGAVNYPDILNIPYSLLLQEARIRKITIETTRDLILEVFYGDMAGKIKDLDKKRAAQLKDQFPEFLFIDGKKVELTPVSSEILKQPVIRYFNRFSPKNKKFIASNSWIKKVYHIYNLITFFPDEYLKEVTAPKDSIQGLIQSFNNVLENKISEGIFVDPAPSNPIDLAALKLQTLIDFQDERTKDFIDMRYTQGIDMKSIGKKHNVSAERVRQKLVAFILECKEELAEIEKKLLTHIVNSLVKSPRILDKDYFENGYMQVETLVSILNSVSSGIPSYSNRFFLSQNIYRDNNSLFTIYTRLKNILKVVDGITLTELLNELSDLSLSDKLSVFRIILAVSYFRIVPYHNTFMIRGRLNLPEMAEQTLLRSETPLPLEQVIKSVKEFYGKEYHDLKVSLCHIRLNNRVLQLDKNLFGVASHISYQGNDIVAINQLVADFLEKEKKVVDASVLYKFAKKQFPRLRSKYELVQILRQGDQISDLGFFCFVHNSVNMSERPLVNEYLIETLSANNFVMNGKALLTEINKKRVVSVTGFSSKLKNVAFIDYYGGNYYGLKDHREQNLKTIAADPVFISNFLFEKGFPDSFYNRIDELFKDFDLDLIKKTISNNENFQIFNFGENEGDVIFSRLWKRNKLYYCILYHQSKPISVERMSEICLQMNISAETLKKINFYALGIDFHQNHYWLRDRVNAPGITKIKSTQIKKKAAI